MMFGKADIQQRLRRLAGLILGGVFILGFLETCDNRLVQFTRYVEPCGTFLANCQPGDFEVNRADVGDFCVDPTCTVPGACGDDQPLGTITDLCP
ncbi:MAG: hypothetical protein JSU86_18235 [Phycisphaerales bacterium]|nr:MAG: hypothetical protein JSU86_18235 [Phycisphaerales bacterium]